MSEHEARHNAAWPLPHLGAVWTPHTCQRRRGLSPHHVAARKRDYPHLQAGRGEHGS